jgi:hypothetical protein
MKRLLAAMLIAATTLIAITSTALAHAKLDKCQPVTGSTNATAPTEVRCWFTEELDVKQSTLLVTNSKDERVDNGDAKVDLNDKDHVQLFATLKPSLPQDVYKVSWHAFTPGDLGITDGEFYFGIGTVTVPQNDPNTLAPAAATSPGSNTVPDTTRTYITAALVLAAAAGIAYVAKMVIR